jgi:hypothetical protein
MIAGTLPERYRDPHRRRPVEVSLEMFRRDYLETATVNMELKAAYNQENLRR